MKGWRLAAAIFLLLLAIVALAWLARARIAAEVAQSYFRQHGIAASVGIDTLGFAGVSGRFALGPQNAPDISAERIELFFDPLRFKPRIVEVRLVRPVVRARMDEQGRVTLPSLQEWIDNLSQAQGQSDYVSDDLAISLTGARVFLATPRGSLQLDGDAKLVKNLPVQVSLRVHPAGIAWRSHAVTVKAARLAFDGPARHVTVQFSGSVQDAAFAAQDVEASLEGSDIRWSAASGSYFIAAGALHLTFAAASLTAPQPVASPRLDIAARDIALQLSGGNLGGHADLRVAASGGIDPGPLPPLRAQDAALANTISQNLSRLEIAFAAKVEQRDETMTFALSEPVAIRGARGGTLHVTALALAGSPQNISGALQADLSGAGLPSAKLAMPKLAWNDSGFTADMVLQSRFNFAMLRGAELTASGAVSWQNGRFIFTPSACARGTLAAFHPGATDLARQIRGTICAIQGKPLIGGDTKGWQIDGAAQDVAAFLPLANARVEKAAATLAFASQPDGTPAGRVTLTAGQISDATPTPRFLPLAATGAIDLRKGVWQGALAVSDAHNNRLGDVTFAHTMKSGAGSAHIAAAQLAFAPGKLQPENLSPLLAALRSADGRADFAGDIGWTASALTSQGRLKIDSLDFLTPLGKAHAVKTDLVFTSLLPPVTADNQQIAISRIDWTLPFSGMEMHFGFGPTAVKVDALSTGWAEGHAALDPFIIDFAAPGRIAGTAQLSSITLSSLVAASNLGSKVKLEGRISGKVPFTAGPEGFRIVNGHVAADGPGRLAIDRLLWTQGGAASANAVQDFAYQALENLAFDAMTADLNSVANGRLQVVFHIKGHSDPPKPQVAEIPLFGLLNGTALQQPVPLPSGTPIDLTLDTSLNFDELLKSYTEAWSKSLSPAGHPDTAPGAKP